MVEERSNRKSEFFSAFFFTVLCWDEQEFSGQFHWFPIFNTGDGIITEIEKQKILNLLIKITDDLSSIFSWFYCGIITTKCTFIKRIRRFVAIYCHEFICVEGWDSKFAEPMNLKNCQLCENKSHTIELITMAKLFIWTREHQLISRIVGNNLILCFVMIQFFSMAYS